MLDKLKTYVDHVYHIVSIEFDGMEFLYGDYITHLVGICGLNALIVNKLIKNIGMADGKELYELCEKE